MVITFAINPELFQRVKDKMDATGLGLSHVLQDWLELTDPPAHEIMALRARKNAEARRKMAERHKPKRKVKPL